MSENSAKRSPHCCKNPDGAARITACRAEVPLNFIQSVFSTIVSADHHTFQVLTKRPEMAGQLPWPASLWMGVSVENADYLHRVDTLRLIPAQTKFLSLEPLLSAIPNIDLTNIDLTNIDLTNIDWVIAGGESGPGARKIEADWVRSIRDQCAEPKSVFSSSSGAVRTRNARGECWTAEHGTISQDQTAPSNIFSTHGPDYSPPMTVKCKVPWGTPVPITAVATYSVAVSSNQPFGKRGDHMEPTKQQLDDLAAEAEKPLGAWNESPNSKQFVIEFAGTPKSGKSTCIDIVDHFFRRLGYDILAPSEGASKRTPRRLKEDLVAYNAWSATYALTQILESRYGADMYQLVLMDRGLFDALAWFEMLPTSSDPSLTGDDRTAIHNFLLVPNWSQSGRTRFPGIVLNLSTRCRAVAPRILGLCGAPVGQT